MRPWSDKASRLSNNPTMKIYTRTGDDGTTGLFGGKRVRKDDPRMECCGQIDELNASIGVAAVGVEGDLVDRLRKVQNELFVIGSHLATPRAAEVRSLPPLPVESVGRLEAEIDAAEESLQPLRQFILPGGSETAARLHLARTVCRRAERALISFDAKDGTVETVILHYLNRLSDWLFVQARWVNSEAGVADIPWEK
jgi:cob(I)alamin adenosyltransferase